VCFRYTFYDGPPFATGLPHYGHILAGTVKDVVTRWAHQSGFHVERRFGWDCHGLPVVCLHFFCLEVTLFYIVYSLCIDHSETLSVCLIFSSLRRRCTFDYRLLLKYYTMIFDYGKISTLTSLLYCHVYPTVIFWLYCSFVVVGI